MNRTLKINYQTNKKKSLIGIAQNKRGFIKLHSLDGKDLSKIPIINAREYKNLISPKEVVDYVSLDRVRHRSTGVVEISDVKKVIKIEGINNMGYRVEDLEKVAETSKLVRNTSYYINGKTKDEAEYDQFRLVLDGLKTNLLGLDFENASLFTEIPLKYCENEIWKNPERQMMNFYKETYSQLKGIKEKVTSLKNLKKHLI